MRTLLAWGSLGLSGDLSSPERESYQAVFFEINKLIRMQSLPPAPPRQRAPSATAERESYQARFLDENRRTGLQSIPHLLS